MSTRTELVTLDSIRENKLSLVERLADDLAHEIKNPLHSMVINLEVLRRRISRLEIDTTEELLKYASVLGSELERVNRRIDLLLRMVRPSYADDERVTLAEVLDDLRELIELECSRHQIRLEMLLPPESVHAEIPRAETRQMIVTLALQTLDSLHRGGALRITSEVRPGSIRLLFQGVDAADLPIALDPPLTDGASLAVVRTLAERIGGRLEIASASAVPGGNGSAMGGPAFVLSLPG